MKSLLIVALAALGNLYAAENGLGSGLHLHFLHDVIIDDNSCWSLQGPGRPTAWSIVMEDDIMMRSDTGYAGEKIVKIEIYTLEGVFKKGYDGCGSHICHTDLSELNPASYEAVVYTEMENSFSDIVTVE